MEESSVANNNDKIKKKDDIQVRRLSIIDFSSEDDSLLGFPQGNPPIFKDLFIYLFFQICCLCCSNVELMMLSVRIFRLKCQDC